MNLNSLDLRVLVSCLLLAGVVAIAQGMDSQPQQQDDIFKHAKELNLTDNQVKDLMDLVAKLSHDNEVSKAHLTLLNNEELQPLLSDEKADPNAIKLKFEAAGALEVKMRLDDIQTARELNAVLSETQLAAWRIIQGKAQGSLFGFKYDLGLSDDQEKGIRKILLDLQKALGEAKLQIAQRQIELDDLLQDEKSEMKNIKDRLDQIVGLQTQMRMMDIAASRQVNGVLTAEQRAKWKEIQKNAKKAATLSRGSDTLAEIAGGCQGSDREGYRQFLELVRTARDLAR